MLIRLHYIADYRTTFAKKLSLDGGIMENFYFIFFIPIFL